jgi:hypothetical protein
MNIPVVAPHVFSGLRSGLIVAVLFFTAVTLFIDWFEAVYNHSAYYLEESFLFSSFWWLLGPLIYFQFRLAAQFSRPWHLSWLILAPAVLHLFIYPLLVAFISWLFYEHTFAISQTLGFAIPTYSIPLLLLYSLPLIGFLFYQHFKVTTIQQVEKQVSPETAGSPTPSLLMVSDRNQKIPVKTADIMYITANYPYVDLHHVQKKYIHSESLKAMLEKLDERCFVRVHKSAVVNLYYLRSFTSRHNGDYDLLMQNNQIIRLSRNYASAFKTRLERFTQDAAN